MSFSGSFVGGLLAVYVLYALWENALFKRVFGDPVKSKMASVVVAYLSASSLAGFGMADGVLFYWGAFLLYLLPALAVGAFEYKSANARRKELAKDAKIEDTFG